MIRRYEEYAYVLDYLPFPPPSLTMKIKWRGPIVQAIGEEYFMLLELAPKPDASFSLGERVFIGKGEREKIDHVIRRITYDELTPTAKDELPRVVEKIVESNEARFVRFFNEAPPLTTRMHSLELLRGVGKKLLWEILRERERKPFESFEDIRKRTRLSDPKKAIVERILEELQGEEKYYLFVKWKQRRV
ncbi:MAG: DUF655 domain-containing protein [Thermoprotei archaeon]|nr:MAG: DUF655 domain-containing protein [Thermoprotei archaeon]RLF22667.1 MAG: DUF655 domain-containing protein [Thermoprotei archaeon]